MARLPAIALLSDFGLADGYVGVMKGVILGIAPGVPLVDLSHAIPPWDVATGAWVLSTSWRAFPPGTVFLCVVDPGVGGERRAVALRIDGRTYVGPDNGLASLVGETRDVEAAVALDDPRYHRPSPSATFHGRDVFAPCAAHLAAGVALTSLGSPVTPDSLVRLPTVAPAWDGSLLRASVVHVDHFGNLITTIAGELATRVLSTAHATLHLGDHVVVDRARTFAESPAERPFLLRDSSDHLAIALREGSAAAYLGARRGAPLYVDGLQRP